MLQIRRTDSGHEPFIQLVQELDAELALRDGEEHGFYHQFNKIDGLKFVIMAYENGEAAGCGAIKEYDAQAMEVKRMFVRPAYRGKGIASTILAELENWAKELSYKKCVLETGKRQPEAINLYQKNGYQQIPNYGQYLNMENSVCFEKLLTWS